MRVLLSNDDGYHAQGLQFLRKLIPQDWDCWLVAPDGERSAISSAISLHTPLRMQEIEPQSFSNTGTPADSVYLGLYQCMPLQPDWVFSGINHGANLGIDIHYSGTVGAAMEAHRAGIRGIAFSLASYKPTSQDWQLVKENFWKVWDTIQQWELPQKTVLNVNFPSFRENHIPKIQITKLGEVVYPPEVFERMDSRGRPYYWVGGKPPHYLGDSDTDTACIQEGNISITPLMMDATHHNLIQKIKDGKQRT